MAEPARLNYLISSCDKFWQCGELRRKRSRAVTQWIFLRLARVKFKRLSYSRRSFRPHCSARLPRLCIFYRAHGSLYLCASVFLRRGCAAAPRTNAERMQVLARSERVKFKRAFRSFATAVYLIRAALLLRHERAVRKNVSRHAAEIQAQIGISARDLQKHVSVHRSRIAAAFEII